MFHFISIYLTPFMHWLSYHHAILFVIIDYGEIPVVGLKNDKQNQEFCNSGPMYLIAVILVTKSYNIVRRIIPLKFLSFTFKTTYC